eukprot:scpid27659/ scgid30011/ 
MIKKQEHYIRIHRRCARTGLGRVPVHTGRRQHGHITMHTCVRFNMQAVLAQCGETPHCSRYTSTDQDAALPTYWIHESDRSLSNDDCDGLLSKPAPSSSSLSASCRVAAAAMATAIAASAAAVSSSPATAGVVLGATKPECRALSDVRLMAISVTSGDGSRSLLSAGDSTVSTTTAGSGCEKSPWKWSGNAEGCQPPLPGTPLVT